MTRPNGGEAFPKDRSDPSRRPPVFSKPMRPTSPSSERLYGAGRSAPPAQPAAKPKPAAPAQAPAQGKVRAPASNKKIVFMLGCLVVGGLALYLIALIGATGQTNPQEIVAKAGPAAQQSGAPAARTLSARTQIEAQREGDFTIRIIELPAAQQTLVARMLKSKEVQDAIGENPAFVVHLREGGAVGCVGKFTSDRDPAATALARKLSGFSLAGKQPFKNAMVWKFK